MGRTLKKYEEIERSLLTKYRKTIYGLFIKAVKDYKLIDKDDKIMVCISGGKDSFLLAKCIQELQKHGNIPFEAKYVVMNPGYNEYNLELIKKNAEILNVPVEIFNSDIFDIVSSVDRSPCYLCARMRRGYLYNKAKELGYNKIALGHHFNDVIETTLLSMFYGSEIKTMLPKLHSTNFEGIDLIRPMCLVKEEDIVAWKQYNQINFINCACRFTENCNLEDGEGKRLEMKKLIREMKKTNPNVENNIYKSMENVNLNCILKGYKDDKEYSFLDSFDKNS